MYQRLAVYVAVVLLASPARGEDQTIIPKAGDYKMVNLNLAKAHEKGWDVQFRGATRNGRIPQPSNHSVRDIISEVTVTKDAISGDFAYVQPGNVAKLTLAATIAADGTVTGTWKAADGRSGAVTGTVRSEADLVKTNAFTTKADWPCWSGPTTSMEAAPCGIKLGDDFGKDARLVWRSEELTPQGPGNTLDYNRLALGHRTNGGGSSLIVAEGKVIINYYQPAGTEYMKDYEGKSVDWLDELAAKANPPIKVTRWMKEKYLVKADDVVVCMDAVTGKTLWKNVFAEKSMNQPSHKGGAVNNTPCAGGGRVFAMGPGGVLHGMDLATGKVLWERTGMSAESVAPWTGRRNMNTAPVYIDETLILPDHSNGLSGIDPQTGKDLWKLKDASSPFQVPSCWTHKGKHYVISLGARKVVCLEPRTGKTVWELALGKPLGGVFRNDHEGQMVFVRGDVMLMMCREAGQKDMNAMADLSCRAYRLSLDGPQVLWTVARPNTLHPGGSGAPPAIGAKHVFVAGAREGKLVEAATGKLLGTVALKSGVVCEGHMILVENYALLTADGSHGANSFELVRLDADGPKNCGTWSPPHHQTSAGDHFTPMVFPVVEGRIFIRGWDGVYCYDLRKK
jgi:outer membrane protein assembly factor BamB